MDILKNLNTLKMNKRKMLKIEIKDGKTCFLRLPFYRIFNVLKAPFQCHDLVSSKMMFSDLKEQFSYCQIKLYGQNQYYFFNALQSLNNYHFRISRQTLVELKNKKFIVDKISTKIHIYWTLKAVNILKAGYLPNYNKEQLNKLFLNQNNEIINLQWSIRGFKVLSEERLAFIKNYY